MNEEEILRKAIYTYGEPARVIKAIEELAELIEELCYAVHSPDGETDKMIEYVSELAREINIRSSEQIRGNLVIDKHYADNVGEEHADVSIMLEQLKLIFDPAGIEFTKARQFKLNRVKERL